MIGHRFAVEIIEDVAAYVELFYPVDLQCNILG